MNLKKLTLEEASQYYSQEEDKLGAPLIGFTLIPDLEDPPWDNVTYYTNRRKVSEYKGEGRYYVYVLENDTMPGILKIGKYEIKDHKYLGKLTLAEIIQQSSNVGASLVALKTSKKRKLPHTRRLRRMQLH